MGQFMCLLFLPVCELLALRWPEAMIRQYVEKTFQVNIYGVSTLVTVTLTH